MKKKILIIDDDPLVLKTLQNLFIHSGYETECVKNGNEAIAKLKSNTEFNLVISDIRMPGKDGIAVINEIKKICKEQLRKELPFLFITGYASEEAPIDAIKLGAKDYLLKPFDLDELLASVKKNIG